MAFPSLLVWVSSCAAMAYVYYGILRLPRGFTRLAASLPLVAFYVNMAPRFETVFERGNYSFFFIWLTSFKLVLLCWDHGPAADTWAVSSFPRFLAVMTLSLQIKRESFDERSRKQVADTEITVKPSSVEYWLKWVDESQEWQVVVLRLLFKLVVLMLITSFYKYRSSIPSLLLYMLYLLHMYVSCSLVFEGIAAVVSPMLGIQFEAAYDKPFLAHSLTDFWGRRWNLLVSNHLRVSVYDPMLRFLLMSHQEPLQSRKVSTNVQGKTSFGSPEQFKGNTTSAAVYAINPPLGPRCIATFSCFLISGLMHELIFYNMSRGKPTGVVIIFFSLNGAATILEVAVRRKTRFRFPRYISTLLTLTFLFITTIWFFFPAIINESATDEKIIAEFQYFFHRLRQAVGGSVR